ncbi:hypothetical protein [Brevibacillus sp. H7]|jgi:hypothetical protein|uniref:hypothetical protein n=1 Tax=Brevibacillus sp. H7 TaxID=3349138 RepID=UPI00381A201E
MWNDFFSLFLVCLVFSWWGGGSIITLLVSAFLYATVTKRLWIHALVSFLGTYLYYHIVTADRDVFIGFSIPPVMTFFMAVHSAWSVPLLIWLGSKVMRGKDKNSHE